MDFINDNSSALDGMINTSSYSASSQAPQSPQPIGTTPEVEIVSGPDDVDNDTLHQILHDAEELSKAQNDLGSVIKEQVEDNPVNIPNVELPSMPEYDIPQYNTQRDEYEVLMPRSFWEDTIKKELDNYELPLETQPTDFFNYLLKNREKLQKPKVDTYKELQETAKILQAALSTRTPTKSVFQNKRNWIIGGVIGVIAIILVVITLLKNKIAIEKPTSWIQ